MPRIARKQPARRQTARKQPARKQPAKKQLPRKQPVRKQPVGPTRNQPARKQTAKKRTADRTTKTASRTETASKPQPARGSRKSDPRVSYDDFKEHEGRRYTGIKVGRGHKWYYHEGEWKETKITPDLWQFGYAVNKRRAGRAPEGSGVPVGTEYHWYILAHQNVRKLDANEYTTSMTGLKFKIAHKRADSDKWSATPKTQRKRMIRFLQDVIADLEEEEAAEPTPVRAGASAGRKPAAPPSMRKPARRRKTARSRR